MTDSQSTNPTPPAPKGKPFYFKPKFIMGAIAGIIFLILIFQNWDGVDLRILFWKQEGVPAALPYLAFSLIGFIVGWLTKRSHTAAKAKK
ncbi:MAG: hypothetical protein ACF8MF_08880 [Phycisphaerales bacterium JB052]